MTPSDSARELLDEMLGVLRREFFRKATEKQFFQERDLLRQAIAYPAAHLKERYGVSADNDVFRPIIWTVITLIKRHGNRAKIKRFSVYFLHSIQKHMAHHGEVYYEKAKGARAFADFLPEAMRAAKIERANVTTAVLVELRRTLRGRRAIPRAKNAASASDLFSRCKTSASATQKP